MIRRISWLLLTVLARHTGLTLLASQAVKASLLPVPMPSLIMAASALMRPNRADFAATIWFLLRSIALPSAIGMTAGSVIPYWLAKAKGENVFQDYKSLAKFKEKRLSNIEGAMRKRPAPYLLALRALPFVPLLLGSLAAGVFCVPAAEFILWTLVGCLARAFILALLGLLTLNTFDALFLKIHRFSALTAFAIIATLLLAFCVYKLRAGRRREN